jgi:hypothetical protein
LLRLPKIPDGVAVLVGLVLDDVHTVTYSRAVTPAEAGVQYSLEDLDSRFRGNDVDGIPFLNT